MCKGLTNERKEGIEAAGAEGRSCGAPLDSTLDDPPAKKIFASRMLKTLLSRKTNYKMIKLQILIYFCGLLMIDVRDDKKERLHL